MENTIARSRNKRNYKWWAAIIGSGLALSPIHNKFLTDLATTEDGEVVFFLPAIAFVLIILGTGFFLLNNWDTVKEIGWGDKRLVAALIVIIAAMSLSGINVPGSTQKLAPLLMGVSLFGLYLAARIIGKDIFVPLAIGSAIASLGVIIYAAVHPGENTGGVVFEHNFDILVGYTLLGSALFIHRYQWVLAALCLVALFLSGAPEALLPVGCVLLLMVWRKDIPRNINNKKLVSVTLLVIVVAAVFVAAGPGKKLYSYAWNSATGEHTVNFQQNNNEADTEHISASPLSWRFEVAKRALTHMRPLGEGYNITGFTTDTVHNVPLIMVQQMGYLGILAALAWILICLYGVICTKWKYVWVAIIALCVFDHYVYDQVNPIIWAAIGASTVATESDLIFRKSEGKSEDKSEYKSEVQCATK